MAEEFDRAAYVEAQNRVYRTLFVQYGRREEALCCSKQKQHERYASLIRHFPACDLQLLDYGCGLGDMKPWLALERPNWRYFGVDILKDFIESNREFHGSDDFDVVNGPQDIARDFDVCSLSGVFNIRSLSEAEHWTIIRESLTQLFDRVKVGLSVDFLASDVDFKQESAHHQDPAQLVDFVSRNLSRRWVLDKSYLPYEFSITIFKGVAISRPRNVYETSMAAP
jgi:hypothetical protein